MHKNRFDYVQYDTEAQILQTEIKDKFMVLHESVEQLKGGRAKKLVLQKLEEAYMWVGKAIRDEQLKRNETTELEGK